ncbi:large extracellular alpha-helical protein [Microbacterium sp. Gd 4-13]|uniref:DUF5719 family protein n=1 Tax=Microbacterium sp. Gd 4-13 TaxID=2173179 RepID=UPI000D579E64|nr:DUF5719 family protein [Microbacterium sp. Gd 4-13]PVW06111.1 large extracellular alpha-helical protein [Microbacterium sp. Gd 4-13]
MTDSRARRWATTSARLVAGTGIAAAAVVAVGAGIAAPWPSLSAEPVTVSATPTPSAATVVCDGPILALGRTIEDSSAISIAAGQSVVSGPSTTAAETASVTGPAGAEPVALSADPSGGVRAELAASGSASLADADLAGFAASSCTTPLMESWLVGGATTTGSNDLVVVSNPGDVAATVQLTVYGVDGPQLPPGGSNRVVAAGSQVVIPLAGLLLGEESPVVRVTSSGAPVRASLQASLARALTPGGVDQVGALAAASPRQVMPGVSVVSEPDGANSATIVRLLAPVGDAEATVTIASVDGSAPARTSTVPLAAGLPSSLAYDDLEPGRYTVTVDASVPVVAGTFQATGFGEGDDFAWYTSAPEISTASVFAVPDGAGAALTIANAATEAATVTLVDTTVGGSTTLSVAAGGSTTAPVSPGSVYRLEPSAPVRAGVDFASESAIASFVVWAADAAAPALTVYP